MKVKGFTLIEMLVTITVAAILAAIAIPSYQSAQLRNRLRASVEQLRSDLSFARAEALKRNRPVVVSFSRAADGSWCYGLREAVSCDCTATTGDTVCFLDRDGTTPILRVVSSTGYRGVQLEELAFNTLTFSPVRPTLRDGNISFFTTDNTVRVVVAGMGRIRLCSPTGDKYLATYHAC